MVLAGQEGASTNMRTQRTESRDLLHTRTNMADRKDESWRPQLHAFGQGSLETAKASIRRFLDLQSGSIWRDVSSELPHVRGRALDVGCGAQPFRSLFDQSVQYVGIDTIYARMHFGYHLPDTVYYDGVAWPVDDGWADFILCTEALEHVYDTDHFLAEARRCLAAGGRVLITVPFSARWHYIPHDYWRFTPSSLKKVLTEAGFSSVVVYARGNEITVACYKVMALIVPLLLPQGKGRVTAVMLRLIGIVLAPVVLMLAVCGNLSLRGRGGDDCLGYTVVAQGGEPR
uniref:Methyltransferase type 11 n=1 Tax=Solibacter usitatus (strain Ellin6076) TaxID=234267 RepID=Q02BA4_SOLUE